MLVLIYKNNLDHLLNPKYLARKSYHRQGLHFITPLNTLSAMNNYSITARFVNVKALRDLPGQSKTHLSNPKTNKKKSWMKRKPGVAITPP